MTFGLLKRIIEKNNIPEDVNLYADTGWECSETEINGVWYHEKDNLIIFTQKGKYEHDWRGKPWYNTPQCIDNDDEDLFKEWKLLYWDNGTTKKEL